MNHLELCIGHPRRSHCHYPNQAYEVPLHCGSQENKGNCVAIVYYGEPNGTSYEKDKVLETAKRIVDSVNAFRGMETDKINFFATKQSVSQLLDVLANTALEEHLLKKENEELSTLFELRYKADCRAIQRWREVTGKELSLPDHADLVVFLLEQLDKARKYIKFQNAVLEAGDQL